MFFHSTLRFPFGVLFQFACALVVLFFALGQSDFELDPSAQKVQVERHQSVTGTFDLADELADFVSVQEQFARARRIVLVVRRGSRERADMHADQKEFSALNDDVGFLDVHPAGTNGLDFPSFENHARLVLVFDEVIVEGFFIDRNAHAAWRSIKIAILQDTGTLPLHGSG